MIWIHITDIEDSYYWRLIYREDVYRDRQRKTGKETDRKRCKERETDRERVIERKGGKRQRDKKKDKK